MQITDLLVCPKSIPARVDALKRSCDESFKMEVKMHWKLVHDLHKHYPELKQESSIRDKLAKVRRQVEMESNGRAVSLPKLSPAFEQSLSPWAEAMLKNEDPQTDLSSIVSSVQSKEDAFMAVRLLRDYRGKGNALPPAQLVLNPAIAFLDPSECLALLTEHGAKLFMIDEVTIKEACEAISKRLEQTQESAEMQKCLWDWARVSLALLELSLPEVTDYSVAIPAIKAVLQQVRSVIDPSWEIPKVRPKKTASSLLDEALALN